MKIARLQPVMSAAILLSAAATAIAASSATFAGVSGQKIKVSFRATGTAVSGLKTSLDVECVSAYPAYKSAIEIVSVSERGSAVLRGGRFVLTLPAPILHPTSKEVTTITGTIHGGSASGTLKSFYLKIWDVYNPNTGMSELALASCAGKTTWTAHR
jgi:hypothetical protein